MSSPSRAAMRPRILTNAVQGVANLDQGFNAIQGNVLGLAIWGLAASVLAGWRFKMA